MSGAWKAEEEKLLAVARRFAPEHGVVVLALKSGQPAIYLPGAGRHALATFVAHLGAYQVHVYRGDEAEAEGVSPTWSTVVSAEDAAVATRKMGDWVAGKLLWRTRGPGVRADGSTDVGVVLDALERGLAEGNEELFLRAWNVLFFVMEEEELVRETFRTARRLLDG